MGTSTDALLEQRILLFPREDPLALPFVGEVDERVAGVERPFRSQPSRIAGLRRVTVTLEPVSGLLPLLLQISLHSLNKRAFFAL